MMPILTPEAATQLSSDMTTHISRLIRQLQLSSPHHIQIIINYNHQGNPVLTQDDLYDWLGTSTL
jgi:hypothetical protein